MVWQNGEASFSNNVDRFPTLKKIIDSSYDKLATQQDEIIKSMQGFGLENKPLKINESDINEVKSALTELVLEGLCWTNPKILDKKELGYVAS